MYCLPFVSIIVQLTLEHRMTMETGTTTRVIGWYHSHPHITVLPSHVGEFLISPNATLELQIT